MKKYPNNNFSTVQPIFTINILIDSGRQAEKCGIIKHIQNFTLGEQLEFFSEKLPLKITFQPMN
jgi:hypothetical protein